MPSGAEVADPGSRSRRRTPRRREVIGYCMFDFANSSYTTVISTVAFSRYFRLAVVGADDPRGDFLWSAAVVAAHGVLILTSPIIGALADHSGRKKKLLLLTTVQTVTACSLLYLVVPGEIGLAVLLFVLATLGFEGGYIFYNAFLPEVATPATMGRISGWSWGTGFIGGLLALIACAPFLVRPLVDPDSRALDPQAVSDYRVAFVITAAFFAFFAIPTFLFLRERSPARRIPGWRSYFAAGFRRVGDTLGHLRQYRDAGRFVVAYSFFFGGIETVIKFSAIYASVTFGIEGSELLVLFIVTNIVAVPGTLGAGYLADWIGGRRSLAVTLLVWIGLIVWGATATSRIAFWILAGGIAVGLGATQAISRSFMAQIAPAERLSEFFGYYLQAGRIGSILALLVFGAISSGTGDQRLAVLWLAPLFIVGLGLTLSVREHRASRAPDGRSLRFS